MRSAAGRGRRLQHPLSAATALVYKTERPEHLTAGHMNARGFVTFGLVLVDSPAPSEVLTAEGELVMRAGTRFATRMDSPLGDIYANPLTG